MRVLYTINLLGNDNLEDHNKLDNVFKEFISKLKQENLIHDYGHKLQKVPDDFIYSVKGELKPNEVAVEKGKENG